MGEFFPINEEQDHYDDELRTFLKGLVKEDIIDLTDEVIDGIVDRARTNEQLRLNWYKYGAKLRQKRSS